MCRCMTNSTEPIKLLSAAGQEFKVISIGIKRYTDPTAKALEYLKVQKTHLNSTSELTCHFSTRQKLSQVVFISH